ncbi:uncharacterized protein V6R79_016194 [Siganus canaliculatus]
MHSVTLDSSVSPKKRTLSRGISEDESLRSLIKETENSSRRLARSDSRAGTLKKRTDSQSDQELFMGLPEMLELQASYDEVVQELRGLEVEREALLFQVDVLQDTLEGVEELLAEAQREAGQASMELEREREAKRRLESTVGSLMQEVERLKEERNSGLSAHREDRDSPLCEAQNGESSSRVSEEAERSKEAEAEPNIVAKQRISQALSHMPTLALDNLLSEDGVLRRPYLNGRDSSPDRNDSDSTSAYEDASAETPELDGSLELPHDSEGKEASGQVKDGGTQNSDACVVC